jgi:hypothetical protein
MVDETLGLFKVSFEERFIFNSLKGP